MNIVKETIKNDLSLWKIKFLFQVMQVFGQYYLIKIFSVLIVIEMEQTGNDNYQKKHTIEIFLNKHIIVLGICFS